MRHSGNSGGVDPAAREAGYILSATMPGAAQILTTIVNIIIIVLGWWSVLLEVFIRYDFGERYLSWLRLFFAYVLLSWIAFFPMVLGRALSIPTAPLITLFATAFVLVSILHRVRIWLRYQKGIPWHSMSFGTSRLSGLNLPVIGGDDWTLYRWYEPVLCFIAAIIIFQFDGITGFVIGAGAMSLLIKNHMVYYQQRGRILDLIDARLESIYYNEQAYGKPKEDVAGMSVMQVVWPKLPPAPGRPEDIEKTVNTAIGGKQPPSAPIAPAGSSADFESTIMDTLNGDK